MQIRGIELLDIKDDEVRKKLMESLSNYTLEDEVKWFETEIEKPISEFDKNDWYWIYRGNVLSEQFIRKYNNKMDWFYIWADQYVSEQFIRDYIHKADWFYISTHQKLSESFIREFKHNLHIDSVRKYQKNISEELKDELTFYQYFLRPKYDDYYWFISKLKILNTIIKQKLKKLK